MFSTWKYAELYYFSFLNITFTKQIIQTLVLFNDAVSAVEIMYLAVRCEVTTNREYRNI
jgi:hypothetical protein